MFNDDLYIYERRKTKGNSSSKTNTVLKGKVLSLSVGTVLYPRSASLFSMSKTAQFRLKVIEFFNKYSVKEASDTSQNPTPI